MKIKIVFTIHIGVQINFSGKWILIFQHYFQSVIDNLLRYCCLDQYMKRWNKYRCFISISYRCECKRSKSQWFFKLIMNSRSRTFPESYDGWNDFEIFVHIHECQLPCVRQVCIPWTRFQMLIILYSFSQIRSDQELSISLMLLNL